MRLIHRLFLSIWIALSLGVVGRGDSSDTKPLISFITNGPVQVYLGEPISLEVYASGSASLSYQWYNTRSAIEGATSSRLLIPHAAATNADSYYVIVTNYLGSTRSAKIPVSTMMPALPVAGIISDQTAYEGEPFTLSSKIVGRGMYYEWIKDGVSVAGQTGESLEIPVLLPSHAGNYKVRGSNAAGSVESNSFALVVNPAIPPRFTFLTPEVATFSEILRLDAYTSGTGSIKVSWYKNGRKVGEGATFVISPASINDEGDYVAVASNYAGSEYSRPIHARWSEPHQVVDYFVQRIDLELGGYLRLYDNPVKAVDTFKWFKDGELLPGHSGMYLDIESATVADGGIYTCMAVSERGDSLDYIAKVVVVDRRTTANGTRAPQLWDDVKVYGDTVYFLYRTQNRVDRYQLDKGTWTTPIELTEAAYSLDITGDGIFLREQSQVRLLNPATNTSTVLFSVDEPNYGRTGLQIDGDYAITSESFGCKVRRVSTGEVISGKGSLEFSNGELARTPGTHRYAAARGSTLSTFSLSESGVIENLESHGLHFTEFGESHERVIATSAGDGYLWAQGYRVDPAQGSIQQSFAEPMQDLLNFGSEYVAIRGTDLVKFGGDLVENGRVSLGTTASFLAARGDEFFAFSYPASLGEKPAVTRRKASALLPPPVAKSHFSDGVGFTPHFVAADTDGTVYLWNGIDTSLLRWSSKTKAFLTPVDFRQPILRLFHLPSHNAIFASTFSGQVLKLDLTTFSVSTAGFLTGPMHAFAPTSSGFVALCTDARLNVLDTDWQMLESRLSTFDISARLYVGAGNRVVMSTRINEYSSLFSFPLNPGVGELPKAWSASQGVALGHSSISPNGIYFRSYDGNFYLVNTLSLLRTDGAFDQDSAWLGNTAYTLAGTKYGGVLSRHNPVTLKSESSVAVPGFPLRVLPLGSNRLVVVSQLGGSPQFSIFDSTLAPEYFSKPFSKVPSVTVPDQALSVSEGGYLSLSAGADDDGSYRYQWYLNGSAITGAVGATYTVRSATTDSSGVYTVHVEGKNGARMSAPIPVNFSEETARLVDISTRSAVALGSRVQVAGFYINGTKPKRVLIRASGPALSAFKLDNLLPDPTLSLYSGANVIASNDNWSDDVTSGKLIRDIAALSGAFVWPEGSKDAALYVELPPGPYTAVISDLHGDHGVGLVEVYEADEGKVSERLGNLSTRSLVTSGAGVQIAGIVVAGNASKSLLIRAIGPTLATFGVEGVLSNPVLTLQDAAGKTLAVNDDWASGVTPELDLLAVQKQVGAFSLNRTSADSAMIVTLPPGAYTAVVSSKDGTEGVALVELYEVR